MGGYGCISMICMDLGGYGREWMHMGVDGWIWLPRIANAWIWVDTGANGYIWVHMGGYGCVGDMDEYGCICAGKFKNSKKSRKFTPLNQGT